MYWLPIVCQMTGIEDYTIASFNLLAVGEKKNLRSLPHLLGRLPVQHEPGDVHLYRTRHRASRENPKQGTGTLIDIPDGHTTE